MAEKAGKSYGLILMKKPAAAGAKSDPAVKRSVFDNSDDEEGDKGPKKLSVGEVRVKKQVKKQWEQALEEDPNAFAYDDVYDQMTKQRQEKSDAKKADKDKKPKYMEQLLLAAEKRQRDYEAFEERKNQKELEKDAELHEGKEVFVTAAYRKKMEELEKYKEEELKKQRIEAMMDVTKQKDLSGFYRHFLNDYEKATSLSSTDAGATVKVEEPDEDDEHPKSSPSAEKDAHWRRHRPEQGASATVSRQKTFRQRRHSSSSESESSPRRQSHEGQRRQTQSSQSIDDDEFNTSDTRKKSSATQDSSPSKAMTRVEKQRRRYFTPSPSPPPQTRQDDDRRSKIQDPDREKEAKRRNRESSPEESPKRKRSREKEAVPIKAVVPEEKVFTEEEIIEQRMEKLRQLFKKRNDEASVDEYRKRYFERKSAISV